MLGCFSIDQNSLDLRIQISKNPHWPLDGVLTANRRDLIWMNVIRSNFFLIEKVKMNIQTSFTILIICWSIVVHSQEAIKTTHFGASVTPQMNTTHFNNKDEVVKNKTFGYAISGDIHFDLSHKSQLIAGIQIQSTKYSYLDYSGTWPNEIDSNGVYHPDKNYFDNQFSLLFIGLPIQLKVKLGSLNKPNHFFLSTGFSLRYRFADKGYIALIEDGTTTIKRDIDTFFWAPNKVWFLGTLGFGYEMKCGNHKLAIAPTFEYSFNKLFNDHNTSLPADGHPSFLGISFSYY